MRLLPDSLALAVSVVSGTYKATTLAMQGFVEKALDKVFGAVGPKMQKL